MIDLVTGRVTGVSAPPLVPMDRPIDLEHLSRATMDDRSLEREVLRLFDRQAVALLERIERAATTEIVTLAHTLKGSARGIGAGQVAAAAQRLETAATATREKELTSALEELRAAVDEARAAIADLLRDP